MDWNNNPFIVLVYVPSSDKAKLFLSATSSDMFDFQSRGKLKLLSIKFTSVVYDFV
jgi:hypothetical protein